MNVRTHNKNVFDIFWNNYGITDYKIWPHWQIIKSYTDGEILEIGAGLKPKVPISGSYFVDISSVALGKLKLMGGKVYSSDLNGRLPFIDNKFDLVCAFEVLEHLPNDIAILKEIRRVLKEGGVFLISFPLNMNFWSEYDMTIGHVRRYSPHEIEKMFRECNLQIIKYAGIFIPWPGKISGKLLTILSSTFPKVSTKIQEWIDYLPFSPIRRTIRLSNWNKNSPGKLDNYSTGLFLLQKKDD